MMYQQKRIPDGTIFGEIPLEAAKSFPVKMFKTHNEIRFAYADINNKENIQLQIKVAPDGAKTNPHPQLIFFVKGDYHIEPWHGYGGHSDPFKWTSWMEFHINSLQIYALIKALLEAKEALEAL